MSASQGRCRSDRLSLVVLTFTQLSGRSLLAAEFQVRRLPLPLEMQQDSARCRLIKIMQPETRYAKSGDYSIAYQAVGDGPIDLVLAPGFISNVEGAWNNPLQAHFFTRLASFSRLIRFDKSQFFPRNNVGTAS